MATSGSIDFSVSRDDIITEALEQMGVLAEGQSPSTAQLTSMSRTLNMMVKSWQADGLNLFAVQKIYVYLEKDKNEYSLSSSSTDHLSTEYNRTTTSASALSSATAIDVSSIAGMASLDYIGIKLDDGTMQWTTINGAPSGSTVTLADALTDDVSSGVTVYHYTSKANRPMKILNASLVDAVSGNSTPVDTYSRSEYVDLPNKTSDGSVTQLYYDPQVGTGKLYVWPETNTVDDYLVLWVQRTLEDFDAASDTADFPQEWYLALALNLAYLSGPKYGVPRDLRRDISMMAAIAKGQAENFDREDGFSIEPEGHR